MALFTGSRFGGPELQRKQGPTGLIVLLVALTIGVLLGTVPAPYVIEEPGDVFNTLGTSNHSGTQVPLISVPGQPTYETSGSLDLVTVSVVGDPKHLPNWLEIAVAWFDSSRAVVPVESVYPPSVTTEERAAENQVLMRDSQQAAIAAALTTLGIAYSSSISVASVPSSSPASGILAGGDSIVTVNGSAVSNLEQLRKAIVANGAGAPAAIGMVRDGVPQTVQVTPLASDKTVLLGVLTNTHYDFPLQVEIQLDDVGGPSAGMMFALGIIDKLTPDSLTGGQRFAGTGTIDANGRVGAIGGIRQKLVGAKRAGAAWFLAPKTNCDEVGGNVPDGLTVFAVSTLADSLTVLKAVSMGGDLGSLPTCASG